MTWRRTVGEVLGHEAVDELGTVRVDLPATAWATTVRAARDGLGCTFWDWLTAVDELDDGFRLVCHLAAPPAPDRPLRRVLLRTLLPRRHPAADSVADLFAGAAWHEREVAEMFGIDFGRAPARLLLPAGFDAHPLRKDFVLASRVAKPWPGAKEPGESDASLVSAPGEQPGGQGSGRARRRRGRPPGVPEPDSWGPREPGSPPSPDPLAAARPGRRGGRR